MDCSLSMSLGFIRWIKKQPQKIRSNFDHSALQQEYYDDPHGDNHEDCEQASRDLINFRRGTIFSILDTTFHREISTLVNQAEVSSTYSGGDNFLNSLPEERGSTCKSSQILEGLYLHQDTWFFNSALISGC